MIYPRFFSHYVLKMTKMDGKIWTNICRKIGSGETALFAAPKGNAKALRQKEPCHDDTL